MRRTTVVIRYVPAGSRNNAHPTTVEKPCASACPVRACHGMRGMLCVVDMWLLYQHDLSRARLGPTHSYWSASHRKTARVNCIRRAKAARSQTFTRTSPQEMHAPSHTRTPKRTSAGRWAIDHCCALKMALSETQEQQRFRYDEGRLNTRKRARNCMQRTLIDTARASRMRAVSRRAMPSPGFQARQHSYWRPQFRWSAYHKVSPMAACVQRLSRDPCCQNPIPLPDLAGVYAVRAIKPQSRKLFRMHASLIKHARCMPQ